VEAKRFEVQALKAVERGEVMFKQGEDVRGEPLGEVITESDRPHVG